MELPVFRQQRALALANAANNLIDLKNERLSSETRRRAIELHKEGTIDRAEFDREVPLVENRLRTTAPADGSIVGLSIDEFERFGENWELATPEAKHQMRSRMFESLCPESWAGQIIGMVSKPGLR